MLLDFALEEYENEPEESKSKVVYAYFGLAVYKAQCLEKEFENMLWLKKVYIDKINSQEAFDSVVDSIEGNKHTMGRRIKELQKIYKFPDDIKKELEKVLTNRNVLVHKYFKLNPEKFFSNKGCKEMLKFFVSFIDESDEIEKKLYPYSTSYKKHLGITEDGVNKIMEKLMEVERKKD